MANRNSLEEYCKNNYIEYMNVNEVRITPGFDLGIDILHIYCPNAYENNNSIDEIIDNYINIFINASENGYKSIVSVSIGTGVHGYKHNDIAVKVVSILNDLDDIDFILVLSSNEIMNIYKEEKLLSLEEFNKLSNKEKREGYIELSSKDKYIVRITQ